MRIDAHPILGPLAQSPTVTFSFNGAPVAGREGEPIAVALWAAGIKGCSATPSGKPQGVYCAIGQCYACRVHIEGGRRNVRACLEPVRLGLRVQSPSPAEEAKS